MLSASSNGPEPLERTIALFPEVTGAAYVKRTVALFAMIGVAAYQTRIWEWYVQDSALHVDLS